MVGELCDLNVLPVFAKSVKQGLFAFGPEQMVLSTVGIPLFEIVIEYFGQILFKIDD